MTGVIMLILIESILITCFFFFIIYFVFDFSRLLGGLKVRGKFCLPSPPVISALASRPTTHHPLGMIHQLCGQRSGTSFSKEVKCLSNRPTQCLGKC